MKYNIRITAMLVGLFLLSQVVGLGFIYQDISVIATSGGELQPVHPPTVIGERPEVSGVESVSFMLVGVLMGTGILLLIIRMGKVNLWKAMFFFAVFVTSWIALGVFLALEIALVIAFALAILKVFRSNVIVHNLTELLIYSGIAVLFVPLLDVFWAVVLLLAISAYDMFAVWKSKHMIKLARFQTESRLFAGLSISTGKRNLKAPNKQASYGKGPSGQPEAILGGGDVAFPLIFSGVVLESLVVSGLTKPLALLHVIIIPVVLALVLLALLIKAEQGKFYPAMPFLTAGCLIGLGIVGLF